jgi:hypothetical protein
LDIPRPLGSLISRVAGGSGGGGKRKRRRRRKKAQSKSVTTGETRPLLK